MMAVGTQLSPFKAAGDRSPFTGEIEWQSWVKRRNG